MEMDDSICGTDQRNTCKVKTNTTIPKSISQDVIKCLGIVAVKEG